MGEERAKEGEVYFPLHVIQLTTFSFIENSFTKIIVKGKSFACVFKN